MLTKLVVASKNKGKLKEIQKILNIPDLELISMDEAGVVGEAVEDGKTFSENAYKKALYVSEKTKLPTVSDDSGLEVDFLNNAPGIYSARYAGENATDAQKIDKLLKEMGDTDQRTARFVCSVCLLLPNGDKFEFDGVCSGEILREKTGEGGFGYDPVFYVPEYHMTFSQMDLELKNKISHRAKAFLALKEKLKELM